jgi:FHA domain
VEQTHPSPHDMSPSVLDNVVRLREWASDQGYPLPEPSRGPPRQSWVVGASPACDLQISDPKGQISGRHACLLKEPSKKWSLLDLPSRNGMYVDGVRQTTALLEPGQEIRIGSVTLVAESVRLMLLRNFLLRILGKKKRDLRAVDFALRALRLNRTRRLPLTLQGKADLVPLAADLHRRAWGEDLPFVLCDPRRDSSDADVRSVANVPQIDEALRAARGGSLCVRSTRPPLDLVERHNEYADPDAQVQLIICGTSWVTAKLSEVTGMTIRVPPLSERKKELPEIVHQYFMEAQRTFHVHRDTVSEEDINWVVQHSARSFHQIEKGAYRLTALVAAGNVVDAARLLGMTPVSLERWVGRRGTRFLRAG